MLRGEIFIWSIWRNIEETLESRCEELRWKWIMASCYAILWLYTFHGFGRCAVILFFILTCLANYSGSLDTRISNNYFCSDLV